VKAIGVVVEYNPFHNGHAHHLEQAKLKGKPDCTIAVMSGNFVQRGEPATLNKWTRAELAVENGVDLVIELPFVYSVQSADLFAFGSIDILDKLKVSELYFGSERDNLDELLQIVSLFNTTEFHTKIKELLDLGNNYPSASGKAVKELTGLNFTSNDNLGIQYISSIQKLNSKMIPYTIERIHSSYLDKEATHSTIASATAIRSMENPKDFVPSNTFEALQGKRYSWSNYFELLKYKVYSSNLENIHGVKEGVENRILSLIDEEDFDTFLDKLYTRRYPQNRLRRILTNILCNISKDDIKSLELENGVEYIRVLAMNDTGRKYLNHIKKDFETPIISKASETRSQMMKIELKTTRIFDSKLYEQEFKPLIYKKSA